MASNLLSHYKEAKSGLISALFVALFLVLCMVVVPSRFAHTRLFPTETGPIKDDNSCT